MTIGMIPVVRLHPHGGYSVVLMEHETAGAPNVIPGYHDRIDTFLEACARAEQEDLHGNGFMVHHEIF